MVAGDAADVERQPLAALVVRVERERRAAAVRARALGVPATGPVRRRAGPRRSRLVVFVMSRLLSTT